MIDLSEIGKAWITSIFPTIQQSKLARDRAAICETCPSKKIITKKLKLGIICVDCGCPIEKKVFSDKFNPCPQKKWKEVDTLNLPQKKDKSSLI